jgi:hypothetical protein
LLGDSLLSLKTLSVNLFNMEPIFWAVIALIVLFILWVLLDSLKYKWAVKLREFIDDVMKNLFSPFTG